MDSSVVELAGKVSEIISNLMWIAVGLLLCAFYMKALRHKHDEDGI